MLLMETIVASQVGSAHSQPRTAADPADYNFTSALNSVVPLSQLSIELNTSRVAQLAQELQQKQQVCCMHIPTHLPGRRQIPHVKGCCPLLAQAPWLHMPCCWHEHSMSHNKSLNTTW